MKWMFLGKPTFIFFLPGGSWTPLNVASAEWSYSAEAFAKGGDS